MLPIETILKVFFGALIAFFAERAVHWWRQKVRRQSIWEQFKGLGDSVSFAISRPLTPENTAMNRECDDDIMRGLCKRCGWAIENQLPRDPVVKKLEHLNCHLFIIGSPKYNPYAEMLQQEFETRMEFVWDLYAGEPETPLLKIVTRHGEEYVATEDLKIDMGENSVDYGLLFHAMLGTGKQVFWLAGIHGPATVGVWKALLDQPEVFADASKTRRGEARTWFFRITYKNVKNKAQRDSLNNNVQVDSLGVVSAKPRALPERPPNVLMFDLGNVLMFFDRTRTYRAIGNWLKIDWKNVEDAISESGLVARYERGEMSSEDFRKKICTVLKVREDQLPMNLFAEFWGDIFFVNNRMIKALQKLKEAQKYVLILLSNTNELHFKNVKDHFPEVTSQFKTLVLSYDKHCDKSTDKIFNLAVEAAGSGVRAQDCIYIDDKLEYVARAESIGMKGIVYFKYPQLVVRLREMGICLP